MKRTTITLAALVVALLPAGAGLWGNASFSEAVPVRVPASGMVASGTSTLPSSSTTTEAGDDHGGRTPRDQRTEPGDDRDDRGSASSTSSGRSGSSGHRSTGSSNSGPGSTSSGHGGHGAAGTPTVDDHGGATPRVQRTESGDDRRSATSTHTGSAAQPTSDDSGSTGSSGGSGRGGADDTSADDHGGHGGDD